MLWGISLSDSSGWKTTAGILNPEEKGLRPPVYFTLIAGVPLHMAHQAAALSLAQFLQVFAVLTQQRGRASNVLACLGYSVNDWKIFPQKHADKIKCIPKKDELSATSCSWFLLSKKDRKPSLIKSPRVRISTTHKAKALQKKMNNLPLLKCSLNFCTNNCFETLCQNSHLAMITSYSTSAEFITHFQLFLFIHACWSIFFFPQLCCYFQLTL